MSTEGDRFRTPVSRLKIPNLSEVDFARLRDGRLARLQSAMRRHDLPLCLFFNPANIRYATGTDVMGTWTAETFARYCLVPAEGHPILFEEHLGTHISKRLVADVRPAHWWQFEQDAPSLALAWANEIRSVMRELGFEGERLGLDRLDAIGFLALQAKGITLVDATAAAAEAREVKTAEEVELFKINGAIGATMLAEFEAAIRPGIRERELLAVLSDALLRYHGEGLFTRLVASGTNTNPWGTEAHDKIVMPGDLIGVDTDAHGFEGYVIDVSRTFVCADRATSAQRDAYRAAYEHVTGMADILRPGMTFEDFIRKSPSPPEKYLAQRYPSRGHHVGLEDEALIPYLEDVVERGAVMPNRTIEENMVLCLECYAGEVGAPFGVKLEDQVLVTKDGCELLCTYPYDDKLLAGN